ncbi:MAG: hypothetical protein ACI9MU_004518, partial [Alphaproteobacteria bacterium]
EQFSEPCPGIQLLNLYFLEIQSQPKTPFIRAHDCAG